MSCLAVVTRKAIICTIACSPGAALTCHIASAYSLSYRACDYVKLWLDVGELFWVCLLQLRLTWLAAYHLAFAIRKQVSTDCARY